MPQQTDGQNLIKILHGAGQSHDTTVHTPHHLLDMTASTDFVSWQRTEIVKNSATVSKCGFSLILISCWLYKEWLSSESTMCHIHLSSCHMYTCNHKLLSKAIHWNIWDFVCLFLLYPRRNKSEISIVIFSYFVNTLANIWKYLTIII